MQLEHMLEGAKTERRSIRSVNLQFCICEADIKTNFIMETYIHQDLRTTKKRSQKKRSKNIKYVQPLTSLPYGSMSAAKMVK